MVGDQVRGHPAERVEDADGDVPRRGRLNGLRVQDLGAESASSAASPNDRHGTSCGLETTRGSAVSMPSTSVQIWISSASSAAPKMAAE
jgi:hypothetical protein